MRCIANGCASAQQEQRKKAGNDDRNLVITADCTDARISQEKKKNGKKHWTGAYVVQYSYDSILA